MLVELDHTDHVYLVLGTQPSYSLFQHPLVKPFGRYWDVQGWQWEKCSLGMEEDETLMMIYQLCKNTK